MKGFTANGYRWEWTPPDGCQPDTTGKPYHRIVRYPLNEFSPREWTNLPDELVKSEGRQAESWVPEAFNTWTVPDPMGAVNQSDVRLSIRPACQECATPMAIVSTSIFGHGVRTDFRCANKECTP